MSWAWQSDGPVRIEPRHVIIALLLGLVAYSMYYVHVSGPLLKAEEICDDVRDLAEEGTDGAPAALVERIRDLARQCGRFRSPDAVHEEER